MKQTKSIILFVSLIIIGIVIFQLQFISNQDSNYHDDKDMIKKTVEVNNEQRIFFVYLPEIYRKKIQKYPVVIVFSGSTCNASRIRNYTKFNDFADKKGIIVVYPEYAGNSNRALNLFDKSPLIYRIMNKFLKINMDWDLVSAEKSKDIEFSSKLIDFMIKNYKVDESRIYATGYSSGAEINYLLACTLPDKIAAIAPVSGNMRKSYIEGCKKIKPVPVLLVHGTKDVFEEWGGNLATGMLSVDETLKFWKTQNKCSGMEKETVFPHKNAAEKKTTAKLYENEFCKNNSEVSILKIEGGGHTWPGSPTSVRIEKFLGKTSYDVEGNAIIWNFFSKHKLSNKIRQ